MVNLRRFAAIVHVDLLTRIRSSQFWLVVAIASGLTWFCFPAAGEGYAMLLADGRYRGQYSSAWIGMVVAMVSLWLSLVGFYMVRGTVRRDIDNKVWELLAVTPLGRAAYLMAKWSGHMAVFSLVLGLQLGVGLVAQWVRAEDRSIDLWQLLQPSLVLALPSLALTAMFAVWFDLLPWLRRTAGNIVYFVIWLAILIASASTTVGPGRVGADQSLIDDPRGTQMFKHAVERKILATEGGKPISNICMVCGTTKTPVERLRWTTWQPNALDLLGRGFWSLLALAGVLMAVPILDRAAAYAERSAGAPSATTQGGRPLRWLDRVLAPLRGTPRGSLLAAELQLTLRQRRLWWWLAMLVAASLQVLAAPGLAAIATMASWVLLIDVLSHAALRDLEFGTAPLVFSAAQASQRMRITRWLLVLLLAWAFTLPAMLRFAITAPLVTAAIALAGASMATWGLALGVWVRNGRLFELGVCILVYLGIEQLPVLHVVAAPAWTVAAHAMLLPLAATVYWLGWPRLTTPRGMATPHGH